MGGKLEKRKLKKLSAFRNKLFQQKEARFSVSLPESFVAVNPSPFGGEVRRGGSQSIPMGLRRMVWELGRPAKRMGMVQKKSKIFTTFFIQSFF